MGINIAATKCWRCFSVLSSDPSRIFARQGVGPEGGEEDGMFRFFCFHNAGGARISSALVDFLCDVWRVEVLWGEEVSLVEILTRPGSARTLCEAKERRCCRYLMMLVGFDRGVD